MTVMDNEDPADPSAHEPRVTGSPETIWLVYGELEHDDTHANCADSGEVTWCEDAQFPADVRYLRADLLYREAREIVAQEVAAERARWASRVDTLTAQLHEVDARYMALLKAVADGVAMQPRTVVLDLGPNVRAKRGQTAPHNLGET